MRRRSRSDEGFTVIEGVVAFGIFAFVSIVITGVLAASLRSVVTTRREAQAKQAAQRILERMRSLPFHRSWAVVPRKVDVLDSYFPSLQPASPSGGDGYVVSSASYRAGSTAPGMPSGTAEVEATFVGSDGSTVVPPDTYSYASSPADTPPSRLLAVAVTVRWQVGAGDRSYTLRSIVGAKRTVTTQGTASASVTAAVATTELSDATGATAESTLTLGESASTVFSGDTTSARTTELAARAELSDTMSAGCSLSGAAGAAAAPPETLSGHVYSAPSGELGFPCESASSPAARLAETLADGLEALLPSPGGLPSTSGRALLGPGTSGESLLAGLFADHDADPARLLRYSDSLGELVPPLGLRRVADRGEPTTRTSAAANADDGVTYLASGTLTGLGRFDLLPTTFAPAGVVQVEIETATVSCNASRSQTGTTATASYSGSVRYWTGAGYASVPITSAGGADPLAAVDPASVVVWSDPLTGAQLHLSDYVAAWSTLTAGTGDVSADASSASMRVDGIVRIRTRGIDGVRPDSQNQVQLKAGTLSCRAERLQ